MAVGLVTPASAADGFHYVPTHLPRPFKLVRAETLRHDPRISAIEYARNRRSGAFDLAVYTYTHGAQSYWYTRGERPITIRGHRGTLAYLFDDEARYGRYVGWEERPGVRVEVVRTSSGGPNARELVDIAEDVARVSDGYWRRLEVGTDPIIDASQLRRRPSTFVTSGRARGRRWTLNALVPRGYRLGWYDYRTPCPALAYRGARIFGLNCIDRADWALLRGQVFVFGTLRGHIPARVRVRDYHDRADRGRVVRTHRVSPIRGFAFYVAPMPRNTCTVMVEDAAKHGRAAAIDIGTPVIRHPREARRCGIRTPGQPARAR